MACIHPDGTLTRCGETMLLAMREPTAPQEVAAECRVPLFRVRSALREFETAGLIRKDGSLYRATPEGIAMLEG